MNESTEHGKVVKATPEELPEQLFLDWTEIWVKEHYFNYVLYLVFPQLLKFIQWLEEAEESSEGDE